MSLSSGLYLIAVRICGQMSSRIGFRWREAEGGILRQKGGRKDVGSALEFTEKKLGKKWTMWAGSFLVCVHVCL